MDGHVSNFASYIEQFCFPIFNWRSYKQGIEARAGHTLTELQFPIESHRYKSPWFQINRDRIEWRVNLEPGWPRNRFAIPQTRPHSRWKNDGSKGFFVYYRCN